MDLEPPTEVRNLFRQYAEEIERLEIALDSFGMKIQKENTLKSLKEEMEEFNKSYSSAIGNIEEEYAKTEEARIKALEDKIQQYTEYLNLTKKDLNADETALIEIGLPEEEANKIKAILKMLNKELAKALGEAETELDLWKKILMDNTGFTEKQMEKMWAGISGEGKSLPVIEQFEQVMDKRGQVFLSLFGDNVDNQIQVAQNAADTYKKLYEDMFTVTLDKDGNIITVWKESEEAAKEAKRAWEEAVDVLNNANFDKYFQGQKKDVDLLLETDVEKRARAQFNQNLADSGIAQSPAQQNAAWEMHQIEMLKQLDEERRLAGLTIKEEAIERLVVEEQITRELAEQYVNFERQQEGVHGIAGIMRDIEEAMENAERTGNTGAYNGLQFAESGMNAMQGSQAGNIMNSAMEGGASGGPWGAVIGAFLAVMEEVMGSMENLNIVMNPITEVAKDLQPIVKALLLPMAIMNKSINAFIKIISPFIEFLFGDMADMYDIVAGTNDERERELEQLRMLNEQYAKLRDSIKENEEYYLRKRRELNADWAIEGMRVNDMILTPHGNFSTNPDDYIIATKNPSTLGGSSAAPVYINIVNNTTATVTAREQTDPNGTRQIAVLVDQIVQNGIASGRYNGAFNEKQTRDGGKVVSG
jgi:hypothetical protein